MFVDYPGHLVAFAILLAAAAATFAGFHAREVKTSKRKAYRWILMSLQYVVILLLLLILWNPSRKKTVDVYRRNTVLTVFDTSQSMSIADDRERTRLDTALDGFADRLHRSGLKGPQYRIYGFDRHAYHCGSPDLLRRWGRQTDLHDVSSLSTDQDALAGVVLFTDGQVLDKNPRNYPALTWSDVPVIVVGVGPKVPSADIAVTSVSAPARVWAETAYPATVTVTGNRPPTESIDVELLCNERVIDTFTITPAQFQDARGQTAADVTGPREVKVAFTVPAQPLGSHVLTAQVKSNRAELNTANNARSTSVQVTRQESLDVLLYSQWASFDIGKIRQSLAWSKRINLDLGFDVIKDTTLSDRGRKSSGYVKLPQNGEAFYEYDAIILGPCDLSRFTEAQLDGLYSFVVDRGGGLMLLPGPAVPSLAAWRDPRGEALLPVLLDEQQERLWPPVVDEVSITFEGQVAGLFAPKIFEDQEPCIGPYYNVARPKPAARTLAAIQDRALVSMHRLGRGRVCLLNATKLFMLYREDAQGGLLSEMISGLVTYLGRTPARGAGVELFAERTADDPGRVRFSACVLDKSFKPVSGANVLLTFDDRVVSMNPTGRGTYTAEIDNVLAESIVARVQAENNGVFLGERTMATILPPVRDEMSETDLDEGFLKDLADRFGGTYVHIDDLDDTTADVFVPRQRAGTEETIVSAWPSWPLLLVLCLLLSAKWFLRRAIGLV